MKVEIEDQDDYSWYLIVSLLFWIGIVIIYRYAIIGNINKVLLLFITILGLWYGLVNLAIAKEMLERKINKKARNKNMRSCFEK